MQRFFKQMINGANRFAHLAVRYKNAEAVGLQMRMYLRLRRTRMIRNNHGFLIHLSSHRTTSGAEEEASSFPSFQPSKFLAVNTANEAE